MSGSQSEQKLELDGQLYGYLTVLGPAENVGTKTTWRCLCDCGRETVAKTHHLGSYARLEDAAKARKRAEEELHDSFLQEVAKKAAGE